MYVKFKRGKVMFGNKLSVFGQTFTCKLDNADHYDYVYV